MRCVVLGKVLARSVSSRPVDAHFSKKYKENSLNLIIYGKHVFWKARFHCLAKSLVPRPNYSARPMHFWSRDPRASLYVIKKMYWPRRPGRTPYRTRQKYAHDPGNRLFVTWLPDPSCQHYGIQPLALTIKPFVTVGHVLNFLKTWKKLALEKYF